MGDQADMVLDGTLCEGCGVFLNDDPPGYPCYCGECHDYAHSPFDKEESKKRKKSNLEKSTQILIDKGIDFKSKNNGVHLIVGEYNFWPSTGLFIHRRTDNPGRGIYNLLRELGVK